MSTPKQYIIKGTFKLENGKKLKDVNITYHTYGNLNAEKNNVIWVCHALTGNSEVCDWWAGLFGPEKLFDPAQHYLVCANIIGSAYGSTNPLSLNPITNLPYYLHFPELSIKDMVNAHIQLAKHLNIKQIDTLIGGSIGGQQALEFSLANQTPIKNLILIASNAFHSPWGIAFNESQRLAIQADRTFYSNYPEGGKKGLIAARSIALLSYRSATIYNRTQAESSPNPQGLYKAASYQKYQGQKLIQRFNAYSYWYLTKAMDSHHIGRGRKAESIAKILGEIKAKTLVIGIDGDLLFPTSEQKYLAQHIPQAKYAEIQSEYGHDAFLIEYPQLTEIIKNFLTQ